MFGKKDHVRQAALERLASPERLDEMMKVTSPAGWMLFLICVTIIVGFGIWSVVHRIPERVNGQGLLIPGRTRAIEAPVTGVVTRVFVEPGQRVQPGDRVIALTVPNAARELDILKKELAVLKADIATEEQEDTEAEKKRRAAYEESKRSVLTQLNRQRVALNALETRLGRMARGGFSVAERAGVQSQIQGTRDNLLTLAQQLEGIEKTWADEHYGAGTEERARQEQLRVQAEKIFLKELDVERIIGAEVEGRVFDVLVDEGNTANTDEMLVRIEEAGQELQALVYVPSRPGQKVRTGHPAEIFPSNISRENFGGIVGSVEAKSDYPSTKAGIVNDIRNETLAEEFIKSGAPLRMEIVLQQDGADPSGYRWTNGEGPATQLIPGTRCDITLIVDEKRPIDYVVPIFKKH